MLKVIGAGFGRTGTSSLQAVLEDLLGGKCYHMKEIMMQSAHLQAWHDFAVGKTPAMDWEWLFADYRAAVDCPVCMYYDELMEVFPEAKVILTVRDPEHLTFLDNHIKGPWKTLSYKFIMVIGQLYEPSYPKEKRHITFSNSQ